MKTVFMSGCFDSYDGLHTGHRYILEEARKLGDKLIVAINSDEYVRRKKYRDPLRPIWRRVFDVISTGMRPEDEIITFDDDTPIKLIEKYKPDIIVVGDDYTYDRVVGNHLAEVVIIPRLPGISTTQLIEDKKHA